MIKKIPKKELKICLIITLSKKSLLKIKKIYLEVISSAYF